MAQVPRAERVFSTMSSDAVPAAASAAASATPGDAHFLRDDIGRVLEARRFASQFLGREEARGHAEMRGDGMDGRLVRLEVDRGDGGE